MLLFYKHEERTPTSTQHDLTIILLIPPLFHTINKGILI